MGVENFTIVDIEINARYSLFVNFQIILIFGLDPGKCLKFSQSEWRMQYPELPIRSAPFNERTLIGRNPFGIYKKK